MTLLAAVAVSPGVAHAAEATVTVLPFTDPYDVVSTGDRVFVSGGWDTTQVVVADAAGTITGTLDGLNSPTDLQLSNDRRTLFVAQPEAGVIAAYDTGSLVQSALYTTGVTCTLNLGYTARSLWFGYGCSSGTAERGIGRVDLGRRPAVVTTGLGDAAFTRAPILATALRNNGVLFAAESGQSPWPGWSYSIGAAGTLTRISQTAPGATGSYLTDTALDPTGTTAYTTSSAPYNVSTYATADLTQAGPTYDIGIYPLAVEISRDGTRVAGGTDAFNEPAVHVFNVDGSAVAQFDLGGQYHRLARSGLAWAPGGGRLYALTNDGLYSLTEPGQLHVLPIPAAE
jgi:hypothetical protein